MRGFRTRHLMAALMSLAWAGATAQISSVLIEACSMLEPAAKRVECLQKANEASRPARPAPSAPQSYASQGGYLQPGVMPAAPARAAPQPGLTPNTSYALPNGDVCHVGPRGGTYTITKSGRKNYSGC